jgi:3-carboxy-cis,cis-muconate cycloisomerase
MKALLRAPAGFVAAGARSESMIVRKSPSELEKMRRSGLLVYQILQKLAGMVQEHERALGGWQAEWDTLPEIVQLSAGALQQMRQVAAGLTVDAGRMRNNLNTTNGLIMAEAVTLALGGKIGRMAAHQLVEKACHRAIESGQHLRQVLGQDAAVNGELSSDELDRLLDPANYLGQATAFVDRVLATHRRKAGA